MDVDGRKLEIEFFNVLIGIAVIFLGYSLLPLVFNKQVVTPTTCSIVSAKTIRVQDDRTMNETSERQVRVQCSGTATTMEHGRDIGRTDVDWTGYYDTARGERTFNQDANSAAVKLHDTFLCEARWVEPSLPFMLTTARMRETQLRNCVLQPRSNLGVSAGAY